MVKFTREVGENARYGRGWGQGWGGVNELGALNGPYPPLNNRIECGWPVWDDDVDPGGEGGGDHSGRSCEGS